MANLAETSTFEAGIYQIETSDPVIGGPSGISNMQAKQLGNRTRYLKDQTDALAASVAGAATEAFVLAELAKLDHKQSVRAATTANISLSGLQTIDGVTLSTNDRVLVKNQSTGAQNGIYLANASAWTRAGDADANAEVTAGLVVAIEEGTVNVGKRWKLTTNGTITVGTTALVFVDITDGYAPLASPALSGNPTAPTPSQFDDDQSLATTEFVQRALGNSRGFVGLTTTSSLTAADCGKDIYASTSSGSITLSLPAAAALKAGAKFRVFNTGVDDVIVSRVGGDTIVLGTTSNTVTAVTLKAGDWIELTSLGTGALWYHSGGTAQLSYSGAFGASLAASGWQRLPSGLIVQWGSTSYSSGSDSGSVSITFPIAFPNAGRSIVGIAGGSGLIVLHTSISTTAATLGLSQRQGGSFGAGAVLWQAIGN